MRRIGRGVAPPTVAFSFLGRKGFPISFAPLFSSLVEQNRTGTVGPCSCVYIGARGVWDCCSMAAGWLLVGPGPTPVLSFPSPPGPLQLGPSFSSTRRSSGPHTPVRAAATFLLVFNSKAYRTEGTTSSSICSGTLACTHQMVSKKRNMHRCFSFLRTYYFVQNCSLFWVYPMLNFFKPR